jgi:hypothetical protein
VASVTNPATAIRRFEKNEVRDVSGPIPTPFGISLMTTHIKGQRGVRERIWHIKDDKILKCEILNPEDKEKNERKIHKFIDRWNASS